MISGKRREVLEELEALDDTTSAVRPEGDWWLPYHVRYFSGRLHEAGLSRDATVIYLRELARAGFCDRHVVDRRSAYRINDRGRAALERAKQEDPDPPVPPIELVPPAASHKGRRWMIRGAVALEGRDKDGFYVIVEEEGWSK